jgi:hypothetical protein
MPGNCAQVYKLYSTSFAHGDQRNFLYSGQEEVARLAEEEPRKKERSLANLLQESIRQEKDTIQ